MTKRYWPILLITPVIATIIGLLAAAVVNRIMPEQYESFAVIEVLRHPVIPNIPTETKRIADTDFFEKVSHGLDLPNRWDADFEQSIHLLRKIIRIDQIHGTDLIRVRARHTNREEARDIIRYLLDAYAEERRDIWQQSDEQKQKREIRNAVAAQVQLVEDLRLELLKNETDGSLTDEPGSEQLQHFDLEQKRLQEMRIALLGETLGGPGWGGDNPYPGIIIHDEPILAESPIYPDARLKLTVGGVWGFLLGLPLALAIMAILHNRRTRAEIADSQCRESPLLDDVPL